MLQIGAIGTGFMYICEGSRCFRCLKTNIFSTDMKLHTVLIRSWCPVGYLLTVSRAPSAALVPDSEIYDLSQLNSHSDILDTST